MHHSVYYICIKFKLRTINVRLHKGVLSLIRYLHDYMQSNMFREV